MNPNRYPQPFLYNNSVELFRDGTWNGVSFSGTPNFSVDALVKFELSNTEMCYAYEMTNMSDLPTRKTLNISGSMQHLQCNTDAQTWVLLHWYPIDECSEYASCGSFGICNVQYSPLCQCMEGFGLSIVSGGCIRIDEFNCSIDNKFLKYSNVKLPDTRSSWYNTTMTLVECKNKCLQNCSCTAYANLDVRVKGSGCMLWFDDLMDVKYLEHNGQDLYVRVNSDTGCSK